MSMPCLHWPLGSTRGPSMSMMATSKKAAGCCCQDALANLVESRLQGVDIGLGEAAAEVTGGGRVGDAAGAKGIQEIDVVAAQLHVLEVAALAENVVGEVEYVIGLMIRQMDLE